MKLVITPHRPVRKALISVALLAAVTLAILVALDYGHWQSIARATVSTGEKRSLLEEAVALRKENAALHYENTRLRRATEIDGHARREHHEQLVRLEAQIAALSREVEFYRDVVGATEVNAGPRVNGIQIKALEGDGRYAYKLVMTHVSKDDRTAEGLLRVDVRGEFEGQRKALGFDEIVESGPGTLGFKFKHFHLFEGTLKMPPGFVPRQIHLAVQEKSRRRSAHEETYDWAAVLN